jgi:hypothetical protein
MRAVIPGQARRRLCRPLPQEPELATAATAALPTVAAKPELATATIGHTGKEGTRQ